MRLKDSEHDFYTRCITLFNIINGTEFIETLNDLRDQTITRMARLNEVADIQREQGKLQILNQLLNYKGVLSREIQRIESEMNEESVS
jgi:hypothetical protein